MENTMKYIVSVSGGLASAYALSKAIACYGKENVIAVFADVKGSGDSHFWSEFPALETLLHERYGGETQDTYRFLWQLSYALDIDILRLSDGRSIWAVFAETKSFRLFVNGKFFCKASEMLKRLVIADWIDTQDFAPESVTMILGMGFWESHRLHNAQGWWRARLGWEIDVMSPLDRYDDECQMALWADGIGLELPSAYKKGYSHNNCGAICVMAGQTNYAKLYRDDPERFHYAAWQEMRLRRVVGIDATILKDSRGDGPGRAMTLTDFAERVKIGDVDEKDMGQSCACFTSSATATLLAGTRVDKVKANRNANQLKVKVLS
jgi:hypothetical protein